MSDRQKSSRAGIVAVALFLIFALVGSFFYSRRSQDSEFPQAEATGSVDQSNSASPAQSPSKQAKPAVAKTLPDALQRKSTESSEPYLPPRVSLTQPDRSGKIAPLQGPSEGDAGPREIAFAYLRSEAPEAPLQTGWTDDDLVEPKVLSETISRKSGVTSLHLRQTIDGIEVYNADMNINVAKNGSVISAHNGFIPNATLRVRNAEPQLEVEEAIARAAQHVAVAHEKGSLQQLRKPEGADSSAIYDGGDISQDSIPTKLVYVATGAEEIKLAWNMVLHLRDGVRWLDLNIDAESGDLLTSANWYANADYNVFAQPLEHPNDGGRSIQTNPHNTSASPFGWHDTNGSAGAEFTSTRGNNVDAQDDIDANNSGGSRPDGGASLVFNNPLNLSQAPSTYRDAAITNLYYWNNVIHDIMWHHGFDEASGNFQVNNYGRGGVGGDPVQADAQDGSGFNNANFGTPPDGQDPRMQMFVWTETFPHRDSDLENSIIIHEYGHGVSNRLTGGPANSSALISAQSRGMGEGWSDWFGLALTAVPSDTSTTPRGIGTYVLGEPISGPGIRPYRYSTDLAENPQTYGNIRSGLSVPHGIGSVWCTTIWEVYWELVHAHGFDSNLYTGTGGNNIALDIVVEGMKLQPANPTYLDARDAIILADQTIYGGANNAIIWQAFAKRGMGFSAHDGGSASSLNVTEAFDLPNESIFITNVTLGEGDSGTTLATFTLTLSEVSGDEVRVDWSAEGDTATPGSDFTASSGQVVFAIGDTSETISVPIIGDTIPEEDEVFHIELSNSVGAVIAESGGVGRITNDDFIVPEISSSLSAAAIDGVEFRYQIVAGNTPRSYGIASALPGMAVNSLTGEVTWTPGSTGNFSFDIVATNPAGSDTETVQVTVLENTVQTALDIGDLTIFHSVIPWNLQITESHDGVDSAESGNITHNETSIMQMDIQGPETMFFWWKVSSEENYDFLRFKVDGATVEEIHGQVDWTQIRYDFTENKNYVVRWEYDKDVSVDIGADAGWVDQLTLLQYDPRPFLTSDMTGAGAKGEPFSYQIETSKPATSFSSTQLPPGLNLNQSTGLISGTPTSGGNTPVTITSTNTAGSTQETINILILELVTLPFSDNFESGEIGGHWAVTGTGTHRTEATQAFGPRGSWHVVMDSSIDQSYSRNEMTVYSDIRGMYDLELKFWAKEFNDEQDGPPPAPFVDGADFDGVAISTDRVNWYEVQPLRSEINGTYSQYTVDIDAEIASRNLTVGEFFGIRFNHYDNYERDTDGFAFDDISVTGSTAALPTLQLSSASDLGTSNSDGITSDSTPTIFGTASPGAWVTLRSSLQGIVGITKSNAGSGAWTKSTNSLADGTHLITASVNGGPETAPISVTIETTVPSVTVTKAAGQADPASTGPVVFDVVFSEDVYQFDESDLVVGGSSAGAATISGGPSNFQVSIDVTNSEGSVDLAIANNAAMDTAGNRSNPSTSPDNIVIIDTHGNDSGSATGVPLPAGTGELTAHLDPTDIDTFEFSIDGPRFVNVYTRGSTVDTRGELRNESGELVHVPNSDDQAGGGQNFHISEALPPGTYTLAVTTNSDEGNYDLHIEATEVPEIQPEMITSGQGDDIYETLVGQSTSLRSKRGRTVVAVSSVANDGEIADTYRISASPGNSIFRVQYTSPVDGNITAALLAGTHELPSVTPNDDPYSINTTISPVKRKIRKKLPKRQRKRGKKWKYLRKNYTTILRAESTLDSSRTDLGSIRAYTTK